MLATALRRCRTALDVCRPRDFTTADPAPGRRSPPGDYVASVIEARFSVSEESDRVNLPDHDRLTDYRLIMPKARAADIVRAERDAKGNAELRAGRRFGVDATWVALAALRVWGHSLTEERDARVGAAPDADRRAIARPRHPTAQRRASPDPERGTSRSGRDVGRTSRHDWRGRVNGKH